MTANPLAHGTTRSAARRLHRCDTRLVRDTTTGEAAPWTVFDRTWLAPGAQRPRPGDHRGR